MLAVEVLVQKVTQQVQVLVVLGEALLAEMAELELLGQQTLVVGAELVVERLRN